MGCPISKIHKNISANGNNKRTFIDLNQDLDSGFNVKSIKKDDEEIANTINKELQDTPQIFVLNNILMSMMFFENYKKDLITLAFTTVTKMEKELNQKLLKDEKISCITPDIIFEKVHKNVRFRPLHGPQKEFSQTIHPKRIFVVNDIIDVSVNALDENPQYTTIDKPSYQVTIEECGRDGFVKLKLLVPIDSIKVDNKAKMEPTPGPSTSSDSDFYDYSNITEINTPKPLEHYPPTSKRRDTLPKTCFAHRQVKKLDIDEKAEELFETVSYISSKGFMKYFRSQKFPHSLGKSLGFDEMEISLAKSIPGKIFCNLIDDDDNPLLCEIIPCVSITWPKQANGFIKREERPIITPIHNASNHVIQRSYQWPTDKMIKDIMSFNCVLVPKGYFQKKGNNLDSEIEWEIQFPKAERYLETRMSNAQIRCYLFLLSVYKTYIEPVTGLHGLLPEHIRCHMFWECEQNYISWPEHRLGTKLIRVIRNLYNKLAEGVLNDFFIQKRNVLDNIPKKYIRVAQEVLHNILENPVMYFIRALRNLRYTSGKFYPTLDFKELHKILIYDGFKTTNPEANSSLTIFPNNNRKKLDKETLWKHKQEQLKRMEVLKSKQEKENLKKGVVERKGSVDSIKIDWVCEPYFEKLKTRQLLYCFFNMFIDLERKSCKIASKEQAQFYLKQAIYLVYILEETAAGFEQDVREFKDTIRREEIEWKNMIEPESPNIPPSTPARNSVQLFAFEVNQQVKSNLVNLNNLNSSYNNGFANVRRVNSKKTVNIRMSSEASKENSSSS